MIMKVVVQNFLNLNGASGYKPVILHYVNQLLDESKRYFHYRLIHLNHRFIRDFYEANPIHSYQVPGTYFKAYLSPTGFLKRKDSRDKSKLYLEILDQHKTKGAPLEFDSDQYVIKLDSRFLLYDIHQHQYFQTKNIESIKLWDIYSEPDLSLIKKPARFVKLSKKQIAKLRIYLPKIRQKLGSNRH